MKDLCVPLTFEEQESYFSAIDKDSSGTIDFEEFCDWCVVDTPPPSTTPCWLIRQPVLHHKVSRDGKTHCQQQYVWKNAFASSKNFEAVSRQGRFGLPLHLLTLQPLLLRCMRDLWGVRVNGASSCAGCKGPTYSPAHSRLCINGWDRHGTRPCCACGLGLSSTPSLPPLLHFFACARRPTSCTPSVRWFLRL